MRAGIIKTIPFVSVTIIIFLMRYRKIPKISPGTYIFQRPFLRGLFFGGLIFGGAYIRRSLSTKGNLRFKIDWASHIIGSKFTVFALLYFVFEGNFPSTSPRGAYIWRGDLTEVFFGGACSGNFTVHYTLFCVTLVVVSWVILVL